MPDTRTPEAAAPEPPVPQNHGMGRRPLRTPFVMLSLKVAPEIRERLERYAAEAGVPMSDVLMRAVESYTSRPRRVIPWPRVTVPRGEARKTRTR